MQEQVYLCLIFNLLVFGEYPRKLHGALMSSISLKPFVMLLVGDEPADAHLVRVALRENRMFTDLHHVLNGSEALAFLRRQGDCFREAPSPDLILMDLHLPHPGANEFLAGVKSDAALRDIPVVVLSTTEDELDMITSYRLGAAGYLRKPMEGEQFIAAIRQLHSYWLPTRLPVMPMAETPLPLRVLLVEDNLGDADLVHKALGAVGSGRFRLYQAETLAKARQDARDLQPEIILLDLSLPETAGLGPLRAMREMASATPIVILAGPDDVELAEQALEAGAQEYLVKGSFGAGDLVRAIRHVRARFHLEARLLESQQQLELALAGADLGFWDWDLSTDKIMVNDRWCAMLGYRLDEIGPQVAGWRLLVHREDWPRLHQTLAAYLRGETDVYEVEHRLQHKNGHWVWVLVRGKVVERTVDGDPIRAVGTHLDISHRKEAEERIHNLAFFDSLTQLPNRRLLLDRLNHAITRHARSKCHGALLFIDLDNFKTVNDTLGHDVGDLMLIETAQRLRGCVRESDTVARLGGDEFIVMLTELSGELEQAAAHAERVGEKLQAALNRPFRLKSHSCHTTPSTGVCMFGRRECRTDELLKRADLAMYQAKAAGRNTIRFFDDAMQTAVEMRAAHEAELRRALEDGHLLLYFQPQVNATRGLIGAEALLRWQHPERGIISPLTFIAMAEETGLILPIGGLVLESACARLQEWELAAATRDLVLAVNISARQFREPAFVDMVRELLARTGINPAHLRLELTEAAILGNLQEAVTKMTTLGAMGIGLAMDDFGTGCSSIPFLNLPAVGQLKLDPSFIADLTTDRDAAIVQAILAMAEKLRIEVIAEGVEEEEQYAFLEQHGCKQFQGYLFGRPMPLAEFNGYCESGHR